MPSDVAREFIGLQKEEIEVRKEELALKSKEVDNSHEYAIRSLEIQEGFYENMPTERRKDRWQIFFIGAFSFMLLCGFFIYLFSTGNGALAAELIKVLAGALFGASAGYGFGFNRGKKQAKQEQQESN